MMLIASVSASAHDAGGTSAAHVFTKHFDKSLFDITANAAYSVEVLPDDAEYPIGKDVVGVVVHDSRDRDVEGADLSISLKDAATGEDLSRAARVEDKHNGLYVVSGLRLPKEGRWLFAITVKKGGVSGGVKFVLPAALKQTVPKGRYSP